MSAPTEGIANAHDNFVEGRTPLLKAKGEPPTTYLSVATSPASSMEDLESAAEQYQQIIQEVQAAIAEGKQPRRIAQGSSGSYFCFDRQGNIVGVFKPKTEEPYAQLNPKWGKWFQRTCCPFFFGRGCLQPNVGYISEASASLVDRKLGLGVVPRTEVIHLARVRWCTGLAQASPAFHYGRRRRRRSAHGEPLPPKIGSFQLFVKGYKDGTIFLQELANEALPLNLANQFRQQFEHMVILDYITRNTDRGNDNWLAKIEVYPGVADMDPPDRPTSANGGQPQPHLESLGISVQPSPGQTDAATADSVPGAAPTVDSVVASWEALPEPQLFLAAIDNGLSFPFKHPDNWRTYPFGWSFLPAAKVPFSSATAERYVDLLSDSDFVEDLAEDLRHVMQQDEGFNKRMFERQMAVMRGQIHNLIDVLKRGKSPFDLTRMAPLTIEVKPAPPGLQKRILAMRERAPWFNRC